MKQVSQTTQFSRDIKRMKKRGKDLGKLRAVVQTLATGKSLAQNIETTLSQGNGSLPAIAISSPIGS